MCRDVGLYSRAPRMCIVAKGGQVTVTCKLALALIISRVVRPGSKLSTLAWWADVTLGTDLGVAGGRHR